MLQSKEGCVSNTVEKLIDVKQSPAIDFSLSANEACKNSPVTFKAENFNDTTGIKQWYFNFDDNNFSGDSVVMQCLLKWR